MSKTLRWARTALAVAGLALALALVGGTTVARAAEPAVAEPTVYVSPRGSDSWSGRFADPTSDRRDGPVATLERAVALVRQGGPRVILLRAGTYRLARTVELGPADSGLRIAAFPGEQPLLSGGERVTGFTVEPSGIVSAPLAREPGLDVTADGGRLWAAQSGDLNPADPIHTGWLVAQAVRGGADKRRFRVPPGTPRPDWLAPGLRVQALNRDRQIDDIRGLRSIDRDGTLTLDEDGTYPFQDGTTFRLLGLPDFLKHPGQFAWRASDRRLLIRPPEGKSAADFARSAWVSVARLSPLIEARQANAITIQGLAFTDVPYDGVALRFLGGSGDRVLGNHFYAVGTAVTFDGTADGEVRGNRMEHLGRNGVELKPGAQDDRILGNRIDGIGEIAFFSAGVMASGVKGVIIAHNDIRDSSRYGISVKNWNDQTRNSDNRIEYNRIRDTGRQTADLGAIETLGRSDIDARTAIRFNDIRDTGGLATDQAGRWLERYKGFGIYLDDLTDGVTVEGNFLENTGWAAIFIHGGDGNRVVNNIAVLNDPRDKFLRLEWVPSAGKAGLLRDNRVARNLIYPKAPVDQIVASLTGGEVAMDQNVIDRSGWGADRRGPPRAPDRAASRAFQEPASAPDGYFLDPAKGDFRLKPDSPARAMGIVDLPWRKIGPEGEE